MGDLENKLWPLLDRANNSVDRRQFAKAERLFAEIFTIKKSWPMARLAHTHFLLDRNRFKEAIQSARLLRHKEYIDLTYSIMGRAYYELGHLRRAEKAFLRSIAAKPKPWTWLFLYSVYSRMGTHKKCKASLLNALKLDPDYDEAHYNLGVEYGSAKEYKPAEKHFRKALEADKNYALAYAELGFLLLRSGNQRLKEATKLLRRAVKLDPKRGWSRIYLGNALWRMRKLKAAKEQYIAAVDVWPNSADSHWCMADFLIATNDEKLKAQRHLKKAIALDPQCAFALYHLGRIGYEEKDKQKGLRLLRRAARLGNKPAIRYLKQHMLRQS